MLPTPEGEPHVECPVEEEEDKIRRGPQDNCGCSGAPAASLAAVLMAGLWVRTRRRYDKG